MPQHDGLATRGRRTQTHGDVDVKLDLTIQRTSARTRRGAAACVAGVLCALSSNAHAQSVLDTIVVTGDREREETAGVIRSDGFVTSSGRSAAKTDTPLLETPQSVSTVTQKQLDERKPQSLLEA